MKTSTFLFLMFFGLCVSTVKAQTFEKGNLLLTADIALNSGTNLIGHVEYGLTNQIGVGGGRYYFSYLGFNDTNIFGRFSYHLNDLIKVDKFDFMGSAELHFGDGTGIAILPGARYYFNEKIAAHAEFTIGASNWGDNGLRLGATFKL